MMNVALLLIVSLRESHIIMDKPNINQGIGYFKNLDKKQTEKGFLKLKHYIHSIARYNFKSSGMESIDLDKLDDIVEENEEREEKLEKQAKGRKISYNSGMNDSQEESKSTVQEINPSNFSKVDTVNFNGTTKTAHINGASNANDIDSFNPENLINDNDIFDDGDADEQEARQKIVQYSSKGLTSTNKKKNVLNSKINGLDENGHLQNNEGVKNSKKQGDIDNDYNESVDQELYNSKNSRKGNLNKNSISANISNKEIDRFAMSSNETNKRNSNFGVINRNANGIFSSGGDNNIRKMPFSIFVPIILGISMITIFIYSILIHKGFKSFNPRKLLSGNDEEGTNLLEDMG